MLCAKGSWVSLGPLVPQGEGASRASSDLLHSLLRSERFSVSLSYPLSPWGSPSLGVSPPGGLSPPTPRGALPPWGSLPRGLSLSLGVSPCRSFSLGVSPSLGVSLSLGVSPSLGGLYLGVSLLGSLSL